MLIDTSLYDTTIDISWYTAMFDSIIDEFISDEYESTSPWMVDTMQIKNTPNKISDNLGFGMIRIEIYPTHNLLWIDYCPSKTLSCFFII